MRLDSEYHLKEFEAIDLFKRNNKSLFCKFEDFGLTIDCSAFYPGIEQYYGLGNNYLIRVQNVKNGVINYDTCETLPTLSSEYNTLKIVSPGDIVITKGGTIGEVGYVTKEAFASRDLIFIKSSLVDSGTSKYLYLYFLTGFAYKQLIRSSSQCAQPHLTITLIKNFDIYKTSDEIIKDSGKLYDLSVESLMEANKSYSEAEELLLRELGLMNWQPEKKSYNIKQLKESFLLSGRLDAEYYQPKYDALFEKLSHYRCNTIGEIAKIKKSIEPGSDAYCDSGVPFVRVSDITKFGISEPAVYLSGNDYNVSELHPKKDTILLSKDGSVGIAYKVEENIDCITSGALLHLNVYNQDYLPDYVTLVLNSIIVRMQAERDSNGAIIQHWKPSEIERVVIPHLPMETQRTIAEKIQQSFALRSENKRLLAKAKLLVESEIQKKE